MAHKGWFRNRGSSSSVLRNSEPGVQIEFDSVMHCCRSKLCFSRTAMLCCAASGATSNLKGGLVRLGRSVEISEVI